MHNPLDILNALKRQAEAAPTQDVFHKLAILSSQYAPEESGKWFDAARHAGFNAELELDYACFLVENKQYAPAEAILLPLANAGESIEVYKQLSQIYLATHRCEQVIDILGPIVSNHYGDAELVNMIGVAYVKLDRSNEAIGLFGDGLKRNPRDFDLNNNYGALCLAQGRLDQAEQSFVNATASMPGHFDAQVNLGDVYRELKSFEKAQQAYQKALTLSPEQFPRLRSRLISVQPEWKQTLGGRKIDLQPFATSHLDYLWNAYSDLAFMKMMSRYWQPPAAIAVLLDKLNKAENIPIHRRNTFEWVVLRKSKGQTEPVGIVSLVDLWSESRRVEFSIGMTDRSAATAGCALEASLMVMDFAFKFLCCHKIYSFVYGDNVNSIDNTKELGFNLEGLLKQHIFDVTQNKWIDLYQFGMLETECMNNQRLLRLNRYFGLS